MIIYNFNIQEIAQDYLDYYINIFLDNNIIDVKKLESNLYRDCDYYKYIPFGLIEEICKQLLENNYNLINIKSYINKFGL